jgi:tRNA A-37 threonylcarbamoyl transferase component Bud32
MGDEGRAEEIVGGYRIEREIGRGAMATVYEAVQLKLRRSVALKILHAPFAAEPKAVRRFLREAEASAALRHPGIVAVHDRGQDGDRLFIALELVEGPTLHAALDRLRGREDEVPRSAELPGPETSASDRIAWAVELGIQIGEALQHAHDRGVTHRDVKPSNILLQEGRAKVADFGLADVGWSSGLTATGETLGTPAYMSPEQALGDKADGRSDVYSLGATLYEMITLRPSVEGLSLQDYFRRIPIEEVVPARQIEPAVGKDLETILAKALAKDPRQRYATPGELADDLRRLQRGDPIRARPEGPVRKLLRRARNRPRAALTLLFLVLLVIGAGVVALVWPEDPRLVRLQVETHDRRHADVYRVPLEPNGDPIWDDCEQIGRTSRATKVDPGECWIIVDDGEDYAEIWADLESGGEASIVARLLPTEQTTDRSTMAFHTAGAYPAPGAKSSDPVRGFHLDRLETTVEEFLEYRRATGQEIDEKWSKLLLWGERHPIRHLTWNQARKYAEWKGKRLSIRSEWLAAFNAGEPRPTGGNRKGFKARPVDDAGTDRTRFDVLQMLGNVHEWSLTWNVTVRPGDGASTRRPTQRWLGGDSAAERGTRPLTWMSWEPGAVCAWGGIRCAKSEPHWRRR